MTGQFWPPASLAMPDGSNLDAHIGSWEIRGAHAVEFSKTAAPGREGVAFSDGALGPQRPDHGVVSIASDSCWAPSLGRRRRIRPDQEA